MTLFDPDDADKERRALEDAFGLMRNDHPDTAREAAAKIHPARLQALVLSHVTERGERGATDDEIIHALDHNASQNSIRPRRVELVRMGLVKDSGERRKTRSGRVAIVWVACPT